MPRLSPHSPLVLIILDGWGYREDLQYNAIAAAHAPFWHHLWQDYPHTLADASGLAVGLPKGQMGNSEVGHLHMGAGRLAPQDLTRIDLAVESGDFFENPVLTHIIDELVKNKHALHIFGLLSPGGVHSHELHIQAMIKLAVQRGLTKIYLHAFLDGRDTPPQSAKDSIINMEQLFQKLGSGQIASIIGRYYAMDRDQRWERTQLAYDLLTQGHTDFHAKSAVIGLEEAYARGENDEFVKPTAIHPLDQAPIIVNDGDKVATYDLQPEMSAELLTARLVEAIESGKYELIICNFANPDMVGHTGNFDATIKAIETINHCLQPIIKTLQKVGGEAVITADHGNAEFMFDPRTGQAHTAHTTNVVPVIYVGRPAEATTQEGVLYDIAPTLLYLLGLEKPAEMTGNSLFKLVG